MQTWKDYLDLQQGIPDPERADNQEWFDFLDRVDEIARLRRKYDHEEEAPVPATRDAIARWVAKRHFTVDNSVREIWYLPTGSPSDEIRLLELNDRLDSPRSDIMTTEFGLDLDGAQFRLAVADVSTEQLDRIRQHQTCLPAGWSLEGNKIWSRKD